MEFNLLYGERIMLTIEPYCVFANFSFDKCCIIPLTHFILVGTMKCKIKQNTYGNSLQQRIRIDRGVKFGLANANPRVEGVMVSAPPVIAFDYNHVPKQGSEEERLLQVLKNPKDWV